MKKRIKNWIVNKLEEYGFYRITNLAIGGHCGCCGTWIPNIIVPEDWRIALCEKCIKG